MKIEAEYQKASLDWLKETRRSHQGTFESRPDVDVDTVIQMPPVILCLYEDHYVVDGHHRINTMLQRWADEIEPITVIMTRIR